MNALSDHLSLDEQWELVNLCDRYEATFAGSPPPIAKFIREAGGEHLFQTTLVHEIVGMCLEYGYRELVDSFLEQVLDPAFQEATLAEIRHYQNSSEEDQKNDDTWFPELDRFTLLNKAGSGGMGVVFRTFDKERNMVIALKTSCRQSSSALYHFKKEFRELADIVHPNLVTLYEAFQLGRRWFFTMQFIEGTDIFNYCHSRGNTVDFDQIEQLFIQLTEALTELHSHQKLHRDIKPTNVLVDSTGHLSVLDFGLVSDWGDPLNTNISTGNRSPSSYAGTTAYMSPEQIAQEPLSPASDWFSAGLLLGDLLTAEPPQDYSKKRTPLDFKTLSTSGKIPQYLIELYQGLTSNNTDDRLKALEVWQRKKDHFTKKSKPNFFSSRETFVGRQKELSILGSVDSEHFTLRLVSGRSGTGKSALIGVYEKKVSTDARALVIKSRCLPNESSQYPGLDGLVDDLTRQIMYLSPCEKTDILPKNSHLLIQAFPVLDTVFGHLAGQQSNIRSPAEASLSRSLAAESLCELFTNLSRKFKIVAFVDDFQWNGEQSLALFRNLASVPFNLVIACRSEHERFSNIRMELMKLSNSSKGEFKEINIGALNKKDALTLIQTVSLTPVRDETAQELITESKGHPYILLEMIRSIEELPETQNLTGVLATRISNLPLIERRLLEIVAVSGIPLPIQVACKASELKTIDPRLLKSLHKAKLVSQTKPGVDSEIMPYHDAIQAATLQIMPHERKRRYHLTLAILLQQSAGIDDPQIIAHHYEESGHPEKALPFYITAAGIASDGLAFEKSTFCLQKALGLSTSIPPHKKRSIDLALAESLESSGKVYEAAKKFETQANYKNGTDRERLLQRAARLYCSTGHIEQGINLFTLLLRNRGMRMPRNRNLSGFLFLIRRLLIQFTFVRPITKSCSKENLKKIDLLSLAVPGLCLVDTMSVLNLQAKNTLLALKCGDPVRMAKTLALESILTGAMGFRLFNLSETLDQQTQSICYASKDPYLKAVYLMGRGFTLHHRGHFSEAVIALKQAEEIFVNHCHQVWWELAGTRTVYLWSLCYQGEIQELTSHVKKHIYDAEQREDTFMESTTGCYSAPMSLIAMNQPQEAEEILRESISAWGYGESFYVQHLIHAYATLSLYLYRGDGIGAFEFYQESITKIKRSGFFFIEFVSVTLTDLQACACLMSAYNELPNTPKNLYWKIKRAIRKLHRSKIAKARGHALKLEGVLAFLQDHTLIARNHLSRAHTEYIENGMIGHALSIEHLLDEIDKDTASSNLEERFNNQGISNPKKWRRMTLGI